MAAEYGFAVGNIAKIVRRQGGTVRRRGTRLSIEDEREILALYIEAELTREQIAERYSVVPSTVTRIARRADEYRPAGRPLRRFSLDEVAHMARLWQTGSSQRQIAELIGATQIAVSRALKADGFTPHGGKRWIPSGELHGSWRGGRITTGSGYIAVMVRPDDPLASMRVTTGYVLEHRLVMARSLGRPLARHETVHHINGDITDNRIENLQLRQGRHGKGVVVRCRCCGSTDLETVPIAG